MTRPWRFLFVVCGWIVAAWLAPSVASAQSSEERLFNKLPPAKEFTEHHLANCSTSRGSVLKGPKKISSVHVSHSHKTNHSTTNHSTIILNNPSQGDVLSPPPPMDLTNGLPLFPWQPLGEPRKRPPGQQQQGIAPPGQPPPGNPVKPANRPNVTNDMPGTDSSFSPGASVRSEEHT